MLTIEKLKEMEPGIFASGVTKDPRLHKELTFRWVAVRGGKHDWAIYYHGVEKREDYVATFGDKCYTPDVIRELVHCDDEAFALYRY